MGRIVSAKRRYRYVREAGMVLSRNVNNAPVILEEVSWNNAILERANVIARLSYYFDKNNGCPEIVLG